MKKSLILFALFFAVACSKSKDDAAGGSDSETVQDSSINTPESAMSEAGQAANASESGGAFSVASMEDPEDFALLGALDPESASINPQAACTFSSARGSCSGNNRTISWGGCTTGSGTAQIVWTGGWTEAFSGSSACTNGYVGNGESVTRTSTGATKQTQTLSNSSSILNGATLTTDTSGGTAWDNTSVSGGGVTVSNSSGTRTITMAGVHKVLKGPHGLTWFDHLIVAPVPSGTALTVTGTRAGGNRVINGSLRLYHNVAKYTADNAFSSVTWGSSSCACPTSGSLTTSYSDSTSSTLTFTSTCGSATFVDRAGASSTVTLTKCQ